MRILYLTEIYPDEKHGIGVWGGGEKRFYEISRRIASLGHDVHVLTCKFPGQPSSDIYDGVKIYRYGLTREPGTGGARRVLLPIFDYISKTGVLASKIDPDIIHCNTYFPVYAGAMAKIISGYPLVTTFHDLYGLRGWINSQGSIIWGLLGHAATFFSARCPQDKIIAVSPQCRDKLISIGVPPNKIQIIPNGVDLELFDSIRVDKVPNQILYVGRLVNFKHVDWLIKALPKVLKSFPETRLKIVGWGPEWNSLHRLVKKLGLEKHVVFTGKTPTYEAVVRYYKESELFVLPSTVEGEAIVLKEAMAAKLPVIAMNVPESGVLSVVKDGENGYLIKPGDPNLIAKKIVQLLSDELLRRKLGEAGRAFIEKYDWNNIAKKILNIYMDLRRS